MSVFKRVFESRFKGGHIIEADWSQLEINVLAIESQDPVLTDELCAGLDLHTAMTALIYNESYLYVSGKISTHDPEWVERRRTTKRARFALQYGAHAPRISQLTGWSVVESQTFIDKYYQRYAGVKQWQGEVAKEVYKTAKPWGVDGAYKGQYTSPSGRRYVFQTYPNKYGDHSFSPNQMKNYPIQGLAADFVAHMIGKLMRSILIADLANNMLLVNTIHDSVILDVHPSYVTQAHMLVDQVYGCAKEGMTAVVQSKRLVNVPLKYTISGGLSWSK